MLVPSARLRGRGRAVGAATTGEVALGDDRQLGVRAACTPRWSGATTIEPPGLVRSPTPSVDAPGSRGRGRAGARAGASAEPSPSAATTTRIAVARSARSAGRSGRCRRRRPDPSRTPATSGVSGDSGVESIDQNAFAPGEERGRARRGGGGTTCRGRAPTSRPAPWRGRPPRRAGRAARSRIRRGSTSSDLGRVGQHVGEQRTLAHRRSATAASSPCRRSAAPSTRRSHCSRPHGSAGRPASRPGLAHVVGGHQLAGREDARLVEVADRALVVDAERGQAVDLVAPQVDADRRVGQSTGRRRRSRRGGRTRRGARRAPRGGSRTATSWATSWSGSTTSLGSHD